MAKKSVKNRGKPVRSGTRVEEPREVAPPVPVAPWVTALWYVAAGLAIWSFGYTIMRGSDLWWHLAAGNRMVEVGSLLKTDPWSYTELGKPWLNDAWLSDLLYHAWVRFLGLESLAWWKWGVLLATFLLLMRTLHRVTGSLFGSSVAAVFAIAVAEAFLDIRPHLYSLLGYSVLLNLTLGRERPSAWLPLLFLIWVQLHAIFVFGLMALAVLLIPHLLQEDRKEARRAAIIGIACVFACLLNPNGITVVTRPLRYAVTSSPFRSIGEWQPPFILAPSDPPYEDWILGFLAIFGLKRVEGGIYSELFPYAAVLFLGVAVFLLNRLIRRPGSERAWTWLGLALSVLTLAMSLRSRRFVPLFAISQSLVLAPVLARLGRWFTRDLLPDEWRKWTFGPPVAFAGVALFLLWPYPQRSYAFHYLMAEDTFPVETLNFIEKNGIQGKVFSYYNWGGYLHLRTQGKLKVYIDGRADMVFPDEIYERYVDVLSLRGNWIKIIEDSGAEYALWPKNDDSGTRILAGLLQSNRWRTVYEDAVSKLLERAERPIRAFQPTDDSPWRELALGSASATWNQLGESERHYRRALELMPHLGAACYDLARVLGAEAKLDEARHMVRHCQSIYPYETKQEWVDKYLNRLTKPR